MAGLACGEVSTLAWKILSIGCNDFMTVDEQSVVPCMKILADGTFGDEKITAGESAVPGLAALIGSVKSRSLKAALNLDEHSKILILGTEGATDPALYDELMG
jgi:diaminopropionate ammonia-lyase